MSAAPVTGPGDTTQVVVYDVKDIGQSLLRVYTQTPDGSQYVLLIPKGKATLDFIRVSAAALNALLAMKVALS